MMIEKNVKKQILQVKPYVPGKPIEEVQRESGLKDVVKLASNESPYGPSSKVLRALKRGAKTVNRYPASDCFYLRNTLAKKLRIEENQLVFGNGSDELIVLAIRAFAGTGDEVIMAKPTFLIYPFATMISGAKAVQVPLQNFRYDLSSMKKAVTKRTKIIFIGNPDNPAGTYVSQLEVERFLQGLRKDILVFFDEAYFEFVQKEDYPDTVSLLKRYKNIIVTRTFSKMYGLAGLRIGYGIGSSGLIDIFNRVREPFNVNSLAQEAALACLEDNSFYRRIVQKIESQRKYLYSNLRKMDLSYVETVTNFILINVRKDSTWVTQRLMRKGVIVRDMSFWGIKNTIRVTIGKPAENRKLISILKGVL